MVKGILKAKISVVIVIILMERAKDGWWQPKYEKEALLP